MEKQAFVVTFEPSVEFSQDKRFDGREMIPITKFLQSFNIKTAEVILCMKIEAHVDVIALKMPSLDGYTLRSSLDKEEDKRNNSVANKTITIESLIISPLSCFSGRVCSPVFQLKHANNKINRYFLEVAKTSLDSDDITCSLLRTNNRTWSESSSLE